MSRTAVFLLGSGPGAAAIRSCLTDLAALGLLSTFHWLDAGSAPGTVATVVPAPDGGYAVREDTIARTLDAARPYRAVLIALDEQDEGGSTIDPQSAAAWSRALDDGLSFAVHRIHLVLTRLALPSGRPARLPAFPQLVLSPEDSLAPGEPVADQHRGDGPDALARYAAPAIAGLAGLWRGAAAVPVLDGPDGPVGTGDPSHVRLVRVFHRRVDTTAVEEELRARAVDVTGGLPRPSRSGPVQVQVGVDDDGMVDVVAGTFIGETRRRVLTGLLPYERAEDVTVGADAAVDAFLADFFGYVIGKPADWGNAIAGDIGRGYARAVQEVLYGRESNIEVMVGHQSGRGPRGSVDDIGRASASFRHAIEERIGASGDGSPAVGPETVAADVWKAYVDTAMTMVDGADRSTANGTGAGMPVRVRGCDGPAVVSRPGLVVADPAEAFDGRSRALDRLIRDDGQPRVIEPFDPYGAERYAQTLDRVLANNADGSLRELHRRFTAWRRHHSASFAWRFGEGIAAMIRESQERMDWARAEFADTHELWQRERDGSRRELSISRTIRGLGIAWALATLAIAYMTLAEYWTDGSGGRPLTLDGLPPTLRWNHGLFWFTVVTFAVLFIAMGVYAKVTKELRARDERRRALAHRYDVASRNVVEAAKDMEKCAHAYNQFLSWSAIIGRVISRPYGHARRSGARIRLPEEGLPRSTALAEAAAEEDVVDEAVRGVRAGLFPGAWAQLRLDAYVAAAHRAADRSGAPLPSLGGLFGQAGKGSGSALDRMARTVVGEDPERDRRFAGEWRAAMEGFAASGGADRLRSGLTTFVDGARRTVGYDDFVRGVDGDRSALPEAGFTHAAMSAEGAVSGGLAVDRHASHVVRESAGDGLAGMLSESITLVQYGPSKPADYVIRQEPPAEPAAGVDPGRAPGLGIGDPGPGGTGGFRLD